MYCVTICFGHLLLPDPNPLGSRIPFSIPTIVCALPEPFAEATKGDKTGGAELSRSNTANIILCARHAMHADSTTDGTERIYRCMGGTEGLKEKAPLNMLNAKVTLLVKIHIEEKYCNSEVELTNNIVGLPEELPLSPLVRF